MQTVHHRLLVILFFVQSKWLAAILSPVTNPLYSDANRSRQPSIRYMNGSKSNELLERSRSDENLLTDSLDSSNSADSLDMSEFSVQNWGFIKKLTRSLKTSGLAQISENTAERLWRDWRSKDSWRDWAVLAVLSVFMVSIEIRLSKYNTTFRRSLTILLFWLWAAVMYSGLVIYMDSTEFGMMWFDGYMLDWLLSFDNLFVFTLVFTYFKTPPSLQPKALTYGILGAVVCRLLFFIALKGLVSYLEVFKPICGVILLYTSYITLLGDDEEDLKIGDMYVFTCIKGCVGDRLDEDYDLVGGNLFRYDLKGELRVTPLAVVVVLLWVVDTLFAFDSVSAKVAEIPSCYIACSSCVLCMLGLRSAFPLIQDMFEAFEFLKYGICSILFFIGIQLVLFKWVHLSSVMSLTIIGSVFALFVLASAGKILFLQKLQAAVRKCPSACEDDVNVCGEATA